MNHTITEPRGVRLRRLNALITGIALVLSLSLLFAVLRTVQGYRQMRRATDNYISGQQDAADFQAGSDYLTEEVRFFTVTGELEHLRLYFQEAEVTRRRERAVESIQEELEGSSVVASLEQAVEISNELMEREYYAMRLVLEGRGYELSGFPEALQSVRLTAEDEALPSEAKLELARSMVFDEVYQYSKDRIADNVQICLDELIDSAHDLQLKSTDRLLQLLRIQAILEGVLLILVFLVVLLTSRLVIRPLRSCIRHIQNQEELPVEGSTELRYLAQTYNSMSEQNRAKREQLTYEATHDGLTDLFNRAAFDKKRAEVEGRAHALVLVDVDHFKHFNDNYGHDMGDLVLKKVADGLRACFRSEDAVCRIGGDEFAVIMVHTGPELRELIGAKIRGLIDRLSHPEDGLPAVTLSVGVAFGCRGITAEQLFKQADVALYRVKNSDRSGCAFYDAAADDADTIRIIEE